MGLGTAGFTATSFVSVEACHNLHLGNSPPWLSFSYRITGEGKSIVYSGDIRNSADLDTLLAEGCDVLLTETGHHTPDAMPKISASMAIK